MNIDSIIDFINEKRRKAKAEFLIPYGRHTYGPQPEIVSILGISRQKAKGSRIGNFCSISKGLRFIFLGKHDYDRVTAYPFPAFYDEWKVDLSPYFKGIYDCSEIKPNPIIIENDVWIATNVTIKEGVTISNGAVVAMNSFVTKNVPPYAIVGGWPARIIKYRFAPEQICSLEKIAWWNWHDEDIRGMLPLLLSHDIDHFIERALEREKQQL